MQSDQGPPTARARKLAAAPVLPLQGLCQGLALCEALLALVGQVHTLHLRCCRSRMEGTGQTGRDRACPPQAAQGLLQALHPGSQGTGKLQVMVLELRAAAIAAVAATEYRTLTATLTSWTRYLALGEEVLVLAQAPPLQQVDRWALLASAAAASTLQTYPAGLP